MALICFSFCAIYPIAIFYFMSKFGDLEDFPLFKNKISTLFDGLSDDNFTKLQYHFYFTLRRLVFGMITLIPQ